MGIIVALSYPKRVNNLRILMINCQQEILNELFFLSVSYICFSKLICNESGRERERERETERER